jgi:hypothetical protein
VETTRNGIRGPYWYGVDLDGTLAYWTEEFPGMSLLEIGPPIPAMQKRVKRWIREGRIVKIFTARMADPETGAPRCGFDASDVAKVVGEWTREHLGKWLPTTCVKDHWMVELWDDRVVQVTEGTGIPVAPYPGEET